MIIRLAGSNDVIKISRLWLQMVGELDGTLTPNIEWWRRMAYGNFKSGNYFMIVAETGGRLVGFIDWFLFPEPSTSKMHAVGQHFFVLPEFRMKSIAGQLYKLALKLIKKNGVKIIELFCFEKELSFWKKHNYKLKRCLVRKDRR